MNANVQSELTKSFDGAEDIAKQYPQQSQQILYAAKESFIHGQHWAYASGILAVLLGAVVVGLFFPGRLGRARPPRLLPPADRRPDWPRR